MTALVFGVWPGDNGDASTLAAGGSSKLSLLNSHHVGSVPVNSIWTDHQDIGCYCQYGVTERTEKRETGFDEIATFVFPKLSTGWH